MRMRVKVLYINAMKSSSLDGCRICWLLIKRAFQCKYGGVLKILSTWIGKSSCCELWIWMNLGFTSLYKKQNNSQKLEVQFRKYPSKFYQLVRIWRVYSKTQKVLFLFPVLFTLKKNSDRKAFNFREEFGFYYYKYILSHQFRELLLVGVSSDSGQFKKVFPCFNI